MTITTRYVEVAQVKRRFQKTDDVVDLVLAQMINGAAGAIDNFCHRPDGFDAATATIRYFPGSGKATQRIDECVAITAVAVKDSATDTAYEAWTSPTANMAGDGDWFAFTGDLGWPDYDSLPYTQLGIDPNGDQTIFTSGLFTGLRGFPPRREGSLQRQIPTVRVTARWGYSADTPDEIREATAMQAMIWYKRMEGSMASALASGELGELEVFRTLDPAIEFILRLGRFIKPVTGRR
jgi:hypothetical protein